MSEYDELLNQLSDRLTTAGKLIPRMCEALKTEGLRTDDINDRVKKDCRAAGLSDSTIIHNMPDEFKDKVYSDAAKKTSHKKKIVVTTDGSEAADSAAYSKPEPVTPPIQQPKQERPPEVQYESPPSGSYTVKSRLIVKTDRGDYQVYVTVKCYPAVKGVELGPINRTDILRVTHSD